MNKDLAASVRARLLNIAKPDRWVGNGSIASSSLACVSEKTAICNPQLEISDEIQPESDLFCAKHS
jgi:hypothetical protein